VTEHTCLNFDGDPRVGALGLGAAALRYQAMGYAVLALGQGGKRPSSMFAPPPGAEPGSAGVHWATTDPRMVSYVWGREPLSGVGVATGRGSNLVVVDLDVKRGEDGPGNFERFQIEASAVGVLDCYVPANVVVSTPSGGYHIWLRTPPGLAVPTRPGILPGVDIKGDDGYVAAVPSRVWEGDVLLPYRMVRGCPCTVPAAPPWFLRWIEQAQATGTDHGENGQPLPGLELLQAAGLPVGERNVTLYRLACSLYRRYGTGPVGVARARIDLETVWAATDKRGFTIAEKERTISGALSFVRRSERERDERMRALTTWPAWNGR